MAAKDLSSLIDGYIETSLVYAAIRAGLPELLASGPVDIAALAHRGGFQRQSLQRLLRGWEMIELCHQSSDGRVELSAKGAALSESCGNGMREFVQLVVEQYAPAFHRIDATLFDDVLPFELAHGAPPFEFRRANPHADAIFNRWLANETNQRGDDIAAAYDWSAFRHIVDVAGGEGSLLRAITRQGVAAQLTLFEQPHVIESVRCSDTPLNVSLIAGDMFKAIPVSADLYVMKSVLHDWHDELVVQILRNVRAAMPPQAHLLVIERLVQPAGPHARSTLQMDLHMLAITGGRERDSAEYSGLLEKSGFDPPVIKPTETPFFLIETTAAAAAA